jgi:hypothetical protein
VLAEISRWMSDGPSLFARQWQALQDAEIAPLLTRSAAARMDMNAFDANSPSGGFRQRREPSGYGR